MEAICFGSVIGESGFFHLARFSPASAMGTQDILEVKIPVYNKQVYYSRSWKCRDGR